MIKIMVINNSCMNPETMRTSLKFEQIGLWYSVMSKRERPTLRGQMSCWVGCTSDVQEKVTGVADLRYYVNVASKLLSLLNWLLINQTQ